jgi:hypothetical protein
MVIAILARAFVHAFTTTGVVLFALAFAACGGATRPPTDAGIDSGGGDEDAPVDADEPDLDPDPDAADAAPDAPDEVDVGADMDAGPDAAGDADDASAEDAQADATDAAGSEVAPPTCGACTVSDWGSPTAVGTIPTAQLAELSGLASSRLHPGTLYAHNDSGDSPRFFAIDDSARLRAQIDLPGAIAIDWEDIAVGPCPTGSCVFIADIGDNDLNRSECVIYRVHEPQTLPGDGSTISATFDRLPFVYPDGWHNAETLLVEPRSQRIFVVTKEDAVASSRVYELPAPVTPNVRATLTFVGSLSVPWTAGAITGGDFNACGDRILVRSRTAMFELTRSSTDDLLSIFGAPPVQVPLAVEPQGEAVTYAVDGTRYFTASERDDLPSVSLNAVDCRNPLR